MKSGLAVPDLPPSYHHERAAVQTRRILSGVQRIEQEFLVAGHSVLSPGPNIQPEGWLLCDPLHDVGMCLFGPSS